MSIQTNHMIMYGVKLPYVVGLDEKFQEKLSDSHNFFKDIENIDPTKIYVLNEDFGGTYTIVGYILDYTHEVFGFDSFVNTSDLPDPNLIYDFLFEKEFEEIVPEYNIPDVELLIFTHIS
jgi:hypothetical protein